MSGADSGRRRSAVRAPDPGKLVGLLWSPSQDVGRRGVTVGSIVATAVRIADAEGLPALSMRRLADEAGVGAMTLYGYLPGRAELLELMLDSVAPQVYAGVPLPRDMPTLRAAVRHIADRNWAQALAHPWVVDIAPGRPIVGPGECLKYELELEPLDGIGLGDVEMDALLATVLSMVASAARWQAALERARADSALDDNQWWEASEPVLAEAMAGLDLPIASRVGASVGSAGNPAATLAYGLTALLDGVAARLG